eukprot:gene22317-8845_t
MALKQGQKTSMHAYKHKLEGEYMDWKEQKFSVSV